MTCDPHAFVAPIHKKEIPLILTKRMISTFAIRALYRAKHLNIPLLCANLPL